MISGAFNGTKIDIAAHPDHFWLGPSLLVEGLRVGSLQDIAASKYNAIASRRQLRDYIDVMLIEQRGKIRLEQGLFLYFRKHALDLDIHNVREFLRHLTDLRHVEDDPAMRAAFGGQIRDTVGVFFRRRMPGVVASLTQLLEAPPPPAAWGPRAPSQGADPEPESGPDLRVL